MNTVKSEGKCVFCDKTFTKAGINRHLQKHLAEESLKNISGKSFLLKIEPDPKWGAAPYFLSLWIDGETTMKTLDGFLRDIWLECCGHMSAFVNPVHERKHGGMFGMMDAYDLLDRGRIKEYEKAMEELKGEVPMSRKAKKVFYKDLRLQYQYDFGSTTQLQVTVLDEYLMKADQEIVLLSRNEPLGLRCEKCEKNIAVILCSVCYGYEEEGLFCPACAKKHARSCEDFKDYSAMPVVNSPRMGVCGYVGGEIDVERDGPIKMT